MVKKLKIVVVDDTRSQRDLIKERIGSAGHDVYTFDFANTKQAANVVETKLKQQTADFLVLDIDFEYDQYAGIWLYNDLVRRGLRKRWRHTIIYSKHIPEGKSLRKSSDGMELNLRIFIDTANIQDNCALAKAKMNQDDLLDIMESIIQKPIRH